MPFEFLRVFTISLDRDPPELRRSAERALAATATQIAGDGYRFETKSRRATGVEMHLVVDVVRGPARSPGETTVREARAHGWHADPGDQLLFPLHYLPGQRQLAAERDREVGTYFSVLGFYDRFQLAGLPLLMRAYYRELQRDVPPLSPTPDGTNAVFRDREEIVRFLAAEDLFEPTYDRLRTLDVEILERCAQALLLAPTDSFAWTHLFGLLADIRPGCFHPYLATLAPGSEPEGRAFVGAPVHAIADHARVLEAAQTPPTAGITELVPGQLIATGDFHEQSCSSDNPPGASMLALLRAGDRRSLAIVDAYLRRACRSQADRDQAQYVALLANHSICTGPDPRVTPIATHPCFQVIEQREGDGSSTAHGHASGSAMCRRCGARLISMFRISRDDLRSWERDVDLVIDTCADCLDEHLDPYFVCYASDGVPSNYVPADAPVAVTPGSTCDPHQAQPRCRIRLEPAPRARGRLSGGEPGSYARIGGTPTWLQPPRAVDCPQCTRPMSFVAETEMESFRRLLLAFECAPCRIVATILEYD